MHRAGSYGDHFRANIRVGAVELVGAESYVHGTLLKGEPPIFHVPGRSRIAMDDEVEVVAPPESLHCFDATVGRL
ncbi:TOBE domain-containing protein [Sinorhizobium numidicum]|uniref:TOBE domain-containing protein n=1 Tax=Sinorhizobium numidicum TaxID=680248 RepID=UPI003144E919